jgi:hypothetical protein
MRYAPKKKNVKKLKIYLSKLNEYRANRVKHDKLRRRKL